MNRCVVFFCLLDLLESGLCLGRSGVCVIGPRVVGALGGRDIGVRNPNYDLKGHCVIYRPGESRL